MAWIKLAIQFLAKLLGIRKSGIDAQTVKDQQKVIDDAQVRAAADDAARRESTDRLRRSLTEDQYPGG